MTADTYTPPRTSSTSEHALTQPVSDAILQELRSLRYGGFITHWSISGSQVYVHLACTSEMYDNHAYVRTRLANLVRELPHG